MSDTVDHRIIEREEAAFAKADAAFLRIKTGKHLEDWLDIGEALVALQDRAMRVSGSKNGPYGPRYTRAYAELKDAHEWAHKFDATTISHTIWLHNHSTDVMRWLRSGEVSDKERERWTHPKVLRAHYERYQNPPETKVRPPSPVARQSAANIELQDEVDRQAATIAGLRREAEQANLLFDMDGTDDQLADAIATFLGERLDGVYAALSRARQPAPAPRKRVGRPPKAKPEVAAEQIGQDMQRIRNAMADTAAEQSPRVTETEVVRQEHERGAYFQVRALTNTGHTYWLAANSLWAGSMDDAATYDTRKQAEEALSRWRKAGAR